MKDNKKRMEEQEQLLDHLIEYGGKQYIDDEVEKFEELPEMELPKDFDDRMDKMFKDAYKKEVHKERVHLGKKIAAAAVIILGAASVTAMNVKAFREPILNFIFRSSDKDNRTKVDVDETNNNEDQFQFNYMPDGYECTKIQTSDNNNQIIYDFKKNNDYIYICLQLNQNYDAYQNMDKSSYTKIINNNITYYYITGSTNKLLWYNHNIIFTISSSLNENTMIKIAENIKINNQK